MPNVGQLILLFFAVFAAALGFACVIRFGTNCIEDKIAEHKIRQADDPVKQKSENDPKIYYIREKIAPRKPKNKPRKKISFAFDDVIIHPEEFREKRTRK